MTVDEPGAVARRIIDQQLDDIAQRMERLYTVLAVADGADHVVTLLALDGLRAQRETTFRALSEWVLIIQPAEKT